MFKPTYRITPFLISCLERIASHKVLTDQAGRSSAFLKTKVARDSLNRNVHSSTWIEGNLLSLAQVSALSANKDIAAEGLQKLEVKNCLKALRWILERPTSVLDEKKLLELHSLMTRGLLPKARCGHYRDIQNYIVNAKKQVIFTPASPSKVKPRIKELFIWLKQHAIEHPIVRSALFHHEFVAIHPFVDGNGRMARSASQWILWNQGYDPMWTLGLDEFFAADKARYYDMIQQTHDMDGDYTHWIEYVAQGLVEAIQAVAQRMKEETRKHRHPSLTPKQNELLELLEKKGRIGSSEICEAMTINRARVNQLIAPLVKANIVIKEGTTRAVKYQLA
jgi:Fic family protein